MRYPNPDGLRYTCTECGATQPFADACQCDRKTQEPRLRDLTLASANDLLVALQLLSDVPKHGFLTISAHHLSRIVERAQSAIQIDRCSRVGCRRIDAERQEAYHRANAEAVKKADWR